MNLKLKHLIKTAKKSQREQKHASIIFDHGRPIAFGFNNNVYHAEESALNWLNPRKIQGKIMVNIRITPGGRIGLSFPCEKCMIKLEKAGIRKVLYSKNDGSFGEIKL